jgi:hypothetical protein
MSGVYVVTSIFEKFRSLFRSAPRTHTHTQWLPQSGQLLIALQVSAWHWYFTSALPRSLLGASALIFIGIYYDWWRVGPLLRPVLIHHLHALPH